MLGFLLALCLNLWSYEIIRDPFVKKIRFCLLSVDMFGVSFCVCFSTSKIHAFWESDGLCHWVALLLLRVSSSVVLFLFSDSDVNCKAVFFLLSLC